MFLEQVAHKILNTGKYLNVVRLCRKFLKHFFCKISHEITSDMVKNCLLRSHLFEYE